MQRSSGCPCGMPFPKSRWTSKMQRPSHTRPPEWMLRLFRWYCHPDYVEDIEGDLLERFEGMQKEIGLKKAQRRFFIEVILLFRLSLIRPINRISSPIPYSMFKHNILISYRGFVNNKTAFCINLIGLSTGLACALLIYLWVSDELSVDAFHSADSRLYQVLRHLESGSEGIVTHDTNSDLLVPEMIKELPEIEYAVPVEFIRGELFLSVEEKKIKTTGQLVGEDFFKIFSYPLVQGDHNTVLSNMNSIVISQQLATAFFGTAEHVIGKTITLTADTYSSMDYAGSYLISGVFDLSEINSSQQFAFLLTNELLLSKADPSSIGWHSNSSRTYIRLREGVDIDEFNQKIHDFYWSKLYPLYGEEHPEWIGSMFVQPYSDRYLYNRYENGIQTGGRIDYVLLFSIIGLIVLFIACINFMNLSTARASKRLKEIGIKKVIGVSRQELMVQYISESLLLVMLSAVLSILFISILIPQFNVIMGKQLSLGWDPKLLGGMALIILFTGFLSGSYPAILLSGLSPQSIFKQGVKTSIRELLIRKGLVIIQFSVSIILIMLVLVISKQIDFIHSKNLGYNKDNVLVFQKEGTLIDKAETFLHEAKKIKGVLNGTMLGGRISEFNNSGWGFSWPGQEPGGDLIQFVHARVGYDYTETLDIEMVEGRSFSREFNQEESKIILNETALKVMQLDDPIGQTVRIRGKREIIGIVKDFHFKSLYEEIKPMFLIFQQDRTNTIALRIQQGKERESIEKLEDLYQQFNPGIPFEFEFLDQEYQQVYVAEQRVASLCKYFAIIAIIISCLGLFGLATFTAERRIKEIGIRKVLGASEWRIVSLLSRDFSKMVLMSILIAVPSSYLIVRYWLASFAYKIDLEWWLFALAALTALAIAWLTVGFQTFRAAKSDPVHSLRSE